jgi:hypothetical protein
MRLVRALRLVLGAHGPVCGVIRARGDDAVRGGGRLMRGGGAMGRGRTLRVRERHAALIVARVEHLDHNTGIVD